VEVDEFLADRGFIRIKDKKGTFVLKTPVGLAPKQKQLSVQDARFRNVVERVFGKLKARWKILGDIISSGLWPKLHSLLRLLAAIENAFFPPLWNDQETDEDDLKMIRERLNMMENELKIIYESKEKECWQKKTYEEVTQEMLPLSLLEIRK
jgi:hypothetical protein